MSEPGSVKRARQPRLAELVAASLRDDILSGRLREGDLLPPLDELLADFQVSAPAGREAIRILETEGLITVRRGNQGGAIVRLPGPGRIGYMASLILEAGQCSLDDVGIALRELEARCAALCAGVPDRDSAVVPALRAAIEAETQAADTSAEDAAAARFHQLLVDGCGNAALILAVRALEAVWDGHGADSAESGDDIIAAHREVAELVKGDDLPAVFRAEHDHLVATARYEPRAAAETAVRSERVADTI
jgi:GntR family transcriptional regulator, transcriptional repressor for pyruvate dehydrogenase complex